MRLIPTPIIPPAAEPVSVADVVLDWRGDPGLLDTSIAIDIAAARHLAEHDTGKRLITQTVRYELTEWPTSSDVIGLEPLQSVAASYWSGTAFVAFANTDLEYSELGAVVVPATGFTFPALAAKVGTRVRLDAVVGYGDAISVPANFKRFIRAHAIQALDNPSLMADGRMQTLPYLAHLLDSFRTYR